MGACSSSPPIHQHTECTMDLCEVFCLGRMCEMCITKQIAIRDTNMLISDECDRLKEINTNLCEQISYVRGCIASNQTYV